MILFISCTREDDKCIDIDEYHNLTSIFFKIEESNRIELKSIIEENHINSDDSVKMSLIELYDIIDIVTEDLLIESGGYHPQKAYLLGGLSKEASRNVLIKFDLRSKIEDKLLELKIICSESTFSEIKACLYPILDDDYYEVLKNTSMAKLYLDLLIIQKRVLIQILKL